MSQSRFEALDSFNELTSSGMPEQQARAVLNAVRLSDKDKSELEADIASALALAGNAATREEARSENESLKAELKEEIQLNRDEIRAVGAEVQAAREEARADNEATRKEAREDNATLSADLRDEIRAVREKIEAVGAEVQAAREEARADNEAARKEARENIEAARKEARADNEAARKEARENIEAARKEAREDNESLKAELKAEILVNRQKIDAVGEKSDANYAELKQAIADLNANIMESRHEQLKWVVTTLIAFGALLLGAVIWLSKFPPIPTP